MQTAVSDYERTREKTIKDNLERMRKLGIFDMSKQLKSATQSCKPARIRKAIDFRNTPRRRSSRLGMKSKWNSSNSLDTHLELGSTPEGYTEERENLLGECKMSWTCFADGRRCRVGKRIYDQVMGKTCHQCRQKTLSQHTTCSKCDLGRGQFCGDCLYTRYGEHVLEANQDPEWICPPCRGICNCSLCRRAKGLAPTGLLYRKIASLGYKSVAHYLSQTHLSKTVDVKDSQIKTPIRKSLLFDDGVPFVETDAAEVTGQQSEIKGLKITENEVESDLPTNDYEAAVCNKADKKDHLTDKITEKGLKTTEKGLQITENEVESDLPTNDYEAAVCNKADKKDHLTDKITEKGLKITENEVESDLPTNDYEAAECNKADKKDHLTGKEMHAQEEVSALNTPAKSSVRKRQRMRVEPSPDSIAGRVRRRRNVV